MMESSSNTRPHCSEEALDLLNCTAESPYDHDKCLRLLQSLRQCVLENKVRKFSLSDQTHARTDSINQKVEKGK